jgi:peptidoglycan biosynthesis protein MviN/MurJ (putative lipid II flippase)
MSESRGDNTGPRMIDIASILVVVAIAGAALAVWRAAPAGPMPLHFDFSGQVDRWGGRAQMALAIALAGAVAAGFALYCLMFQSHGRDPDGERFTYGLGRIVGLAVPAFVALLLTLAAFGRLSGEQNDGGPFLRVMMAGMALLSTGLGAFLGRAKPNPVVGVRTYWSLRSRLAWDKSNRLAGRLLRPCPTASTS